MMSQSADLRIENVQIVTMNDSQPSAEAVVIRGNRIVFVDGRFEAEEWQVERVINGRGGTLIPGIIDSHFHLWGGSMQLADMQLEAVKDGRMLGEAVRAFAAANPDRQWLTGYQLIYFPSGLTRHDLDAIEAERPLLLFAYDMHTAWANTRALEMGGILRGGSGGPAGEIVIGEDGLASGELRESGAFGHLTRLLPELTPVEQRTLLLEGLRQAAALGITSVHNMDGSLDQIGRYAALEDLGQMSLRVYMPYSITPDTTEDQLAEAVAMREEFQGEMVRGGAVKFFMDGVVESYTALVFDDYVGQPGNKGDALYSADHFNRMAAAADRLGLQIFVHAIGDAAVNRVLNGYAYVREQNGRRDRRHRLEHIELIAPQDIPRLAELEVIASMQPLHAPADARGDDVWPGRVGLERWPLSFAWQTLRQAGAWLVFGSDWPVVSQNPYQGMAHALQRPPWLPGLPDQRQTLMDALASYTRDAAFAEFQEHQKGQLRPGFLADMVLLPGNLFEMTAEEIGRIRPMMTVCDGRVVYEQS
ncbi:MAG: amidohydrolase [Candidatus Promineifilaceae bacterium]